VAGVLDLFTDASVKGGFVLRRTGVSRDHIGPAMGAWIGWHDKDPSTRPSVAGQAFLGRQGTQRAEYLAAIHGLQAVLAYARVGPKPDRLILHVDNGTVVKTLHGEWTAWQLRPYYEAAVDLIGGLAALGIGFQVESVSEKHPQHRLAHRMSRSAWNHVFFETTWRPPSKPPAALTRTASTTTARDADVAFMED